MQLCVTIQGLPPKKDGASSMWGKPLEVERLKSLRLAVADALATGPIPAEATVTLSVTIWGDRCAGDLDNFITGICDGLQAAHPRTPVDEEIWAGVDARIHPRSVVAICDDCMIDAIRAERRARDEGDRYTLVLDW